MDGVVVFFSEFIDSFLCVCTSDFAVGNCPRKQEKVEIVRYIHKNKCQNG